MQILTITDRTNVVISRGIAAGPALASEDVIDNLIGLTLAEFIRAGYVLTRADMTGRPSATLPPLTRIR